MISPRRGISPAPGFDWSLVNWGGPDQPVSDECSYCGDAIREDAVPLRLFRPDGWAAVFCDHCQAAWWGIQSFDDPVEPQPEPEVKRNRMPPR